MTTVAREALKRLSSMEEFTAELNAVMPVVTRVARRFAPTGHAEDVTQEACLAAWRYRHRFDPEQGSFQNWILKIVFHESYKAGARGRRNGLLIGRLTDRSHLSTQALPAGWDRQLEITVARLPRRQREVIGLYYFVDLPVQQVADLLGISSGTVKSTLADARRSIEAHLAEQESS
jgi:RNA polymerase sigma-70 factor (ECF subfamily)